MKTIADTPERRAWHAPGRALSMASLIGGLDDAMRELTRTKH